MAICKQTYTRILQCSLASVGLAQAHPNNYIHVDTSRKFSHAKNFYHSNMTMKTRSCENTGTQYKQNACVWVH